MRSSLSAHRRADMCVAVRVHLRQAQIITCIHRYAAPSMHVSIRVHLHVCMYPQVSRRVRALHMSLYPSIIQLKRTASTRKTDRTHQIMSLYPHVSVYKSCKATFPLAIPQPNVSLETSTWQASEGKLCLRASETFPSRSTRE